MKDKVMEKERLGAFIDAVIAIIMTILVLELEKPQTFDLQGLWELRTNFFAYALSFFWLGAMWINLHFSWRLVEKNQPENSLGCDYHAVFLIIFSLHHQDYCCAF